MRRLLVTALVAVGTTSALQAQERPNLLAAPYLEAMTWTEIRDAIQGGKRVAIIPTGGTEQNAHGDGEAQLHRHLRRWADRAATR